MTDPYMTQTEMAELERLLTYKRALEETLSCWIATRINHRSASLGCEGNISIPLIHAFDEVRELTEDLKWKT